MSRWFILRTSGGQTLPLMKSLRDAGFDVWSPARTIRRLMFRGTASQRSTELDVPILPTFVFAREAHIEELAIAAARTISPHPAFSIFRHGDRVPLVSDGDVAGLQEEEARATETIQAIRAAETHAEAEKIRIAAIKSEAARRRATKELERARLAELRSSNRSFAPGTHVDVLEAPAFAGVAGVVEASDGSVARVRFGALSWKIDAWRLTPSTLMQAA